MRDTLAKQRFRSRKIVYQDGIEQQGAIRARRLVLHRVLERQTQALFEELVSGAIIPAEERSAYVAKRMRLRRVVSSLPCDGERTVAKLQRLPIPAPVRRKQ